jgi:hypothetical protein
MTDCGMPMPALVFWMPMPTYANWYVKMMKNNSKIPSKSMQT